MEILVLHLQSFLEYAHVRGIDREELVASLKAPVPDCKDPGASVTAEDFYRILAALDQQLGNEGLGWRIGHFLNLNALGLIYQISLQATTLEEAIYYLEHFIHTTFPLIRLEKALDGTTNHLALSISTDQTRLNSVILECVLVIMARELRMMSEEPVALTLSSPFYTHSYPPDFKYGDEYRISFTNFNLKAALRRFDQARLHYLIPQYLKLIEELKRSNNFQNKVKIALLNMAQPQLPRLDAIAAAFYLTPRTLQRMLAREKLSFRQLTDDLKKQLAVLLLRHQGYSITDVGYLLGYSEPAAFVHSFKKWYGYPPSTIRQESSLG